MLKKSTSTTNKVLFLNFHQILLMTFAFLKSDPYLPKKLCYLLDCNHFKSDKRNFLFHLKSSFRFQDT